MILRRLADAITAQNWFTVVLEIFIVVVGIFIGLQVDDWNQSRKDRADIATYLERIQGDLQRDAEFFTFLTREADDKRNALQALKQMLGTSKPEDKNPDEIFNLLKRSLSIGFEFPEVQTVTFLDLQTSGKLVLIGDAGLRTQLSFYYQESLHRSDRIESRITGYAATIYKMVDPQAGIVRDSEFGGETIGANDENFDMQAAVESFFAAAQKAGFSSLLTAEQNYTEFMIKQLKSQMEQITELQHAIADAIGKITS